MADTPDHSLAVAAYVAGVARHCWEELWPAWKRLGGHPNPDGHVSEDVCIPTAFALCEMLSRTMRDWQWLVVGGSPTKRTPHGGYRGLDGQGGGHLWVKGRRHRRTMTVDITADQFGGPELLIVEGTPSTHHANSSRRLLRTFEAHEKLHVMLWVAALAWALQAEDDAGDSAQADADADAA